MGKVIVIGSGFSGLSAASFLAKAGHEVEVFEKNSRPGGRAGLLEKEGFRFDMGPSWYWMPDIFERYFAQFGKHPADYYSLIRLDPSYRVYWKDESHTDIPANYAELRQCFENIEAGSGEKLDRFLEEAEYKYRVGIGKLVYKPGKSLREFLDRELISGLFRLDVFTNMSAHIGRFFSHPKLKQLMEFPVLFLGARPEDTPALYSLMNYADIKLGTWYPQGGMYEIVKGMYALAESLGVKFRFNEGVNKIVVREGKAVGVETNSGLHPADVILSSADYHHTETKLLEPAWRQYSDRYWQKRTLAPSCLIWYLGIGKKIKGIQHHNLFFDADFKRHANEIYKDPAWPEDPLFYVSAPSVTDDTVAPDGMENLFVLIPVAPGLEDDASIREKYFEAVLERMEQHWGQSLRDAIVLKESFGHNDFVAAYHSFKGNAYGLANTLNQTAILKPSLRSKKVKNLLFAGQLTVPGPGVPPSLISGEIAAAEAEILLRSSQQIKKYATV